MVTDKQIKGPTTPRLVEINHIERPSPTLSTTKSFRGPSSVALLVQPPSIHSLNNSKSTSSSTKDRLLRDVFRGEEARHNRRRQSKFRSVPVQILF